MPLLSARPEAIDVDFASSALVVVDMQNAFAKKGGLLDLAGLDITAASRVIDSVRGIVAAARAKGMAVVYLQMGFKPGLSDSGGELSPNWHKELALRMMRSRPELHGKLLMEGTWDFAIVDELKPEPGDIVIRKTRYSGFTNPELDRALKARGIRHLFFTGIATNVCVESTLRHAFFLDYFPILIADATMAAGPQEMQKATEFNVESFFGWIVEAAVICEAKAGAASLHY